VLPWVFAIWITMTGHFQEVAFNWFTGIALFAPTLCTAHLLALSLRSRRRHEIHSGELI